MVRRALLLLTLARARVLELDAEELEPLRRTSQLPAAGASDLIEVFTLRTKIDVPSLFEEAVMLEHYALAFRNQGVSWKEASEGEGVVAGNIPAPTFGAFDTLHAFVQANRDRWTKW